MSQFLIIVKPDAVALSDHPDWKADKSTPISWSYRIDQCPGKMGISFAGGYSSKEEAQFAAAERIASWN